MPRMLLDTEDGTYFHMTCRDSADPGLETVDEEGMTCTKCGQIIEDENGDPTTHQDDDDEKEDEEKDV